MAADMKSNIPFNVPPVQGREIEYLKEVLANKKLCGDGPFTKRCHSWFEQNLKAHKALLTHSCTAALEMSAMLANLEPGDEVIMPSFTFVSTANAIVLRRATPVFVDIRPDTQNIDEKKIEAAITPKTKAIFVVHYAGVSCEMDEILAIAKKHTLLVLEDAAQGLLATYKGRALGTIGELGALSFHETKNIVSGEGGALLINDAKLAERAEIIREKGTDRSKFLRGQLDKYTWVDIGSSYLPSELNAAVLLAQLEDSQVITDARIKAWNVYNAAFENLPVQRPVVPADVKHNGHMYYLVTKSLEERTKLITSLKEKSISSVFHYIPLHSAPAGRKYGRTHGDLSITNHVAETLVRLPLFASLNGEQEARVIDAVTAFYKS
jgi:dTDP-4-amino-4,6-dideoxygalactose transaminase